MASVATHSPAPLTEISGRYGTGTIASLLAEAGNAVALQRAAASAVDEDEDEARAAVEVLVAAIQAGLGGHALPSLARYPFTAEAPRLIAELRRGLLSLARESRTVEPFEVLEAVEVMERLLVALEADVASRFVEALIGPHALQLLVEVAHDVRSPLGSILFLVERMRRGGTGPVSPMQERHLGLVYSAAFGLSAMASDLMELARGGARLIGPSPVAFSIAGVLHAVRDVVQPIAEEKSLRLRFSGPSSDTRVGHPAALTRVLLNLVTNALKFTNNGSVTVSAEALPEGMVRFVIEDTGRGMPPAVAARVTDVFARPLATGDYSFSSAGLGIAMCRKLVDAMDGELSIAASRPVGTRVECLLHLPCSTH